MTCNHEQWLRKTAQEIRDGGHNGWGNVCEGAADEIKRLTAALASMKSRGIDPCEDQLSDGLRIEMRQLIENAKYFARNDERERCAVLAEKYHTGVGAAIAIRALEDV